MNLYVARNKVNGKCYVGQTKFPVEKRIKEHCCASSMSLLGRALKKYGEEPFDFFAFNDIPDGLIDVFEIQMIALIDSIAPDGYNISLGGQTTRIVNPKTRERARISHLGYKMPEEQKKKISDANKGKKKTAKHVENMSKARRGQEVSFETRRKISDSLKGKPSANKGRRHTEEQKRNNAEAHRGKRASEETKRKMSASHRAKLHPNSRAVICVETGKVFKTIRAAAAQTELLRTSISSCCTGRRKTCGNYHWNYYNAGAA